MHLNEYRQEVTLLKYTYARLKEDQAKCDLTGKPDALAPSLFVKRCGVYS
jgi:hypothetical protein